MPSEFPIFEPLSIEHREHIETIAAQFDPYSDFNFTSLFSWNTAGSVATCMLNGNLVIRFEDYVTGKPFYSFLGTNDASGTSATLLAHMEKEGIRPEIKLLPSSSLGNIHPEKFLVTEDPDNHDYVLSIERLLTFSGSRLKPNRNLVTRFLKSYASETRTLDLSDPSMCKTLTDFFLEWARRKNLPESHTKNEFRAMSRALELSTTRALIGLGVYVDGALVGFTISERLHGAYGMLHFEKADPTRCVGIYQFLMRETAKILAVTGCELLNYQQDLGLQGLKTCKRGFHPSHYLRKYRVAWIDAPDRATISP